MKLVIEEYLKSLREKDELDLLLCDLLLLEGYTIFNRPKTGERQYGVDILAKKGTHTYLFVIKQKDITRSSWDSGPDSVRQSLNDILDVYLNTMLPPDYLGDCIDIVIVTNGYLQTAVQQNWNGFQENNKFYNNIPIKYEFWNIDTLVQLSTHKAFNETLFNSNVQSLLRKTLYYMDESDFSNRYFEQVINWYIVQIKKVINKPTRIKKEFISFYTCVSLMNQWAKEQEHYKIAIDLLEYSLIKIWELFVVNNCFEKEKYTDFLMRFTKLYMQNNKLYLDEVFDISGIKYGAMNLNTVENRLLVFEIAGRISTYGLYCTYNGNIEEAQVITNVLILFLNNNPAFKYPVYDDNIIELSLIFLLLKHSDREDLKDLIHLVIQGIIAQYMESKTIPAPNDNFEEVLCIHFKHDIPEYKASVLFGGLLEWVCIENMNEDFEQLNEVISTFFKDMTCQTWQIKESEENALYSHNAPFHAGISIPFTEYKDMTSFSEILKIVDKTVKFEEFTFNKYSFEQIAFICSRYYHYPILPQFWRCFLDK